MATCLLNLEMELTEEAPCKDGLSRDLKMPPAAWRCVDCIARLIILNHHSYSYEPKVRLLILAGSNRYPAVPAYAPEVEVCTAL